MTTRMDDLEIGCLISERQSDNPREQGGILICKYCTSTGVQVRMGGNIHMQTCSMLDPSFVPFEVNVSVDGVDRAMRRRHDMTGSSAYLYIY